MNKKIFIAHRGLYRGPDKIKENSKELILEALKNGFDVEIDVWVVENNFWLGHDTPTYQVDIKFLKQKGLWCHCKNIYCKF